VLLLPRSKQPLPGASWLVAPSPAAVQAHRGNFGCRLGQPPGASGCWLAPDFDGSEGLAAHELLEREHGPLPGWRVATGGGGLHIYMRGVPGTRSCRLQLAGGLTVELKAEGAYVVWPGSMHPNGKPYVALSERPEPLPDAPRWLISLAARSAHTGGADRSREFAPEPVPATIYVPALTGREPDERGYIVCPFHKGGQERTPSFKVYDQDADGRTGWACYPCGVSGHARQLAALVLGLGEVKAGRVPLDSEQRVVADRYLRAMLAVAP
jgi:hypothetical protein